MSGRPFMQLYVSDYLGDTRHLSTEQHGAYLLLLMSMWNAEGALPDEDKKLARITGLSLKKWRAMRGEIEAFFCVSGGLWRHERLTGELQKSAHKSQARAAAGARGGRAKALKSREAGLAKAKAKGLAKPRHLPEAIYTHSSLCSEWDKGQSKNHQAKNQQAEFHQEFDQAFWPAYPRKVKRPHALKAFVRARAKAGLDEIMAGLEAYLQNKPDYADWRHPATWLSDEGWSEDYGPPGAASAFRAQGPPPPAAPERHGQSFARP